MINNSPTIKVNNKEDVEFITKFDLLEILNNFENKIINSIENSIKKTINSLNIPEVVSDYVLDEVSKHINIEPSKVIENQSSHKVNISNIVEGEVLHNVNVSIKKAVHEILDSGFLLNKDAPIISNIIEETITKSECLDDHWVTDILKTLNNVTWILHPHGISSLKKEVELGVFKHIIQCVIDMDFK